MFESIWLNVLILIYLIYSVIFTKKLYESNILDNDQKRMNTIMLWLIPFVWGLIVRSILKTNHSTNLNVSNKKYNSHSNFDNWKNLTGMGGGEEFS